jgi:4-hydroxy-tetrahydrodipicolinate synthase
LSSKSNGDLADLAEAFRGITVTIVTPFSDENLDIDLGGMRSNLRALVGSGISVIAPAGNTGEYHSLTVEEIKSVASVSVEEAAGQVPIVVGVGGDLRTAIALARYAQGIGAAGILLHEPAHTFATEEGLYQYYLEICQAVDFGVAIYKRTPRLTDKVILRVARACPNVVAIKYAWNDVASYSQLVGEAPSRVTCACGSAERWALPFSSTGTTGFTSGIANFAPDRVVEYWRALQKDPPAARAMWRELARIEDLRAAEGSAFNVPVVKLAMDLAGHAAGPARPPLSPVRDDMARSVRCILAAWGIVPSNGNE